MLIRRIFAALTIIATLLVLPAVGANADPGEQSHGFNDTDGVWTEARTPATTKTVAQDSSGPPDPCSYTFEAADPDGRGNWYQQECSSKTADGPQIGFGQMVLVNNPPRPERLARSALAKVRPVGVEIGIVPKGTGLVGLPVYLWAHKSDTTWGPLKNDDYDGNLIAHITAKAVQINWNMGDGHTVVCTDHGADYVGTPYNDSFGAKPSPDCGYQYSSPSRSQPSGTYHIVAVSTWQVDWTADFPDGRHSGGQFMVTRESATDVKIEELQVVVG